MPAGEEPVAPAMGVAVRALVPDAEGRLLLVRRAQGVGFEPGRWELPGGKVEYGESAIEALVRETREETGLVLEVGPPVHVFNFRKESSWVTCVTFACTSSGGRVELDEEHDDVAWIEPSGSDGPPPGSWATGLREQIAAYRAFAAAPDRDRPPSA